MMASFYQQQYDRRDKSSSECRRHDVCDHKRRNPVRPVRGRKNIAAAPSHKPRGGTQSRNENATSQRGATSAIPSQP